MKLLIKQILESLPENNQLERIWLLAKTDFKQRYYESNLGLVWALINPLFRLIIYYVVFTMIFQSKIENYALYLFSGLLLWMFFSETSKKGINILIVKRYLIENIPFNKLDLFVASTLAGVIGLLFNFFVYFVLSLFFSVEYNITVLYFPVLLLNLFILVFAVSIILSTIHIYVKDIIQLWDMFLILIFWTSPIFYGRDILFEKLKILLYLNPLSGIMNNVREVLIYGRSVDYYWLVYDYVYAFVLLGIGLVLFRKYFHKAAEKI